MSHSTHHLNYMNGVPVKISENYKPPKKIALTQNVQQRLANPATSVQLLAQPYDFTLERTVLAKMSEWQHVRAQENCDRKERMRIRLLERQKQIEAKQKQMLTAISYPSADDFSSDDDRDDKQSNETKTMRNGSSKNSSESMSIAKTTTPTPVSASTVAASQQQFSPPNYFDSILVPTVMPGRHGKKGSITLAPCNTKINYSDFENDTSSPFDNVELKTINDLDILAEVLKTKTTLHDEAHSIKSNATATAIGTNDGSSRSSTPNVVAQQNNNLYMSQSQQQQHHHHHQQQQPQHPSQLQQSSPHQLTQNRTYVNAFYDPANPYNPSNYVNNATIEQSSPIPMYQPTNYHTTTAAIADAKPKIGQYFYSTTINANNPYDSSNSRNSSSSTTTSIMTNHSVHPNQYIQSNYFSNANYNANSSGASTVVGHAHLYTGSNSQHSYRPHQQHERDEHVTMAGTVIANPIMPNKSKSKSVPDIMQEINVELKNSERKWIRNNSQCDSSPADESSSQSSNATDKSQITNCRPASVSLYHSLSESSQQLATNISSMGFPLERVARITEKLGRDDKKIVEHLIPLSELLDLGFDENKISDALLKFDNNKEKALDFLIS